MYPKGTTFSGVRNGEMEYCTPKWGTVGSPVLNRILLVCYTSNQNLCLATLSLLMTKEIVLFVKKGLRTDSYSSYSV